MDPSLLRCILSLRSHPQISSRITTTIHLSWTHQRKSHYSTTTTQSLPQNNNRGQWFTLPPYTSTLNGTVLGKALATNTIPSKSANPDTALKWVLKCCPQLPRNLVQKLFRLRQVRKELSIIGGEGNKSGLKRVAAKELMTAGERILLPITVQVLQNDKEKKCCNVDEVQFIRGLELYKDDAIIVVNKPPGMPVQGGIGVKRSLDGLAATCLIYDYPEPPRLVHRLDRDSSGILVLGRTQTSTTILHSIFREKTFAASDKGAGRLTRTLRRKYWALVIGSPRRPEGLITAPLGKVVVDNGKSDRITVVYSGNSTSSQDAVTEYRVIASSPHGYTWLELSPLTGRKHQLRVHCAEVLGTPIVGDYKYGWQTHKKWKPFLMNNVEHKPNEKMPPFGLDFESGSICETQPRLHLHCKQMVLPNVSEALQETQKSLDYDLTLGQSIVLDAPMPSFMKRSWDLLSM